MIEHTHLANGEGAYHWKNGLYFQRLPDGAVRIFKRTPVVHADKLLNDYIPFNDEQTIAVISAEEWVSIIAIMTGNATYARYADIRKLHSAAGE